jgi:hypothetical protein
MLDSADGWGVAQWVGCWEPRCVPWGGTGRARHARARCTTVPPRCTLSPHPRARSCWLRPCCSTPSSCSPARCSVRCACRVPSLDRSWARLRLSLEAAPASSLVGHTGQGSLWLGKRASAYPPAAPTVLKCDASSCVRAERILRMWRTAVERGGGHGSGGRAAPSVWHAALPAWLRLGARGGRRRPDTGCVTLSACCVFCV